MLSKISAYGDKTLRKSPVQSITRHEGASPYSPACNEDRPSIQAKSGARGWSYYTLTGATPKKRRLELAERFNADDVLAADNTSLGALRRGVFPVTSRYRSLLGVELLEGDELHVFPDTLKRIMLKARARDKAIGNALQPRSLDLGDLLGNYPRPHRPRRKLGLVEAVLVLAGKAAVEASGLVMNMFYSVSSDSVLAE